MKNTKQKSVDTLLLSIIVLMIAAGFLVFSSASLGLMARQGASFNSVALNQFLFGVVGGGIALLLVSNFYYRHWSKYAFYIFVSSLLITLLVFVPGLGMSHAGATRWIDLGFVTFQPSEFLKIGFIIYLATWLSGTHKKIEKIKYGLFPFVGIVGVVGVILLLQPDTDTFLIMAFSGLAMFIVAGARWRDIGIVFLTGIVILTILAITRPYIMDRLTTFMHPEADPLGSSYQIHQSLIAVGSGGITGRGYGQSIQKFEYLPEAIGDSVFAVYAEEFGFIGSTILILCFIILALRGYRIATQTKDIFGSILIVGFITLIISQAFLNIAAMLAIAPLSGLTLPFISHGGTALMSVLASLGIVLNVSKYRTFKKTT